jgi:uncharacterized protein
MAQTAAHPCDDDDKASPKWSHGTFFWNELMTRDPEGARKFYAETLGWTFEPMPMAEGGTYWVAKSGERMAGGIFELKGGQFQGVPESWMAYIAVDDVDARAKKAVEAGATLMRPLFDIPGIGRIAILREPGGAGIGWITPVAG